MNHQPTASVDAPSVNTDRTDHMMLIPLHSRAPCAECGRPLAGDEAKRWRHGFAHVGCTDVVAGPRGT